MSGRERRLVVLLLLFIFVGGGGFFGYKFYYQPSVQRAATTKTLRTAVGENELKLLAIQKDKQRQAIYKKLSLPADVSFSRREYSNKLVEMLRASDFANSAFSVLPKPADTRTNVTASKKPPFTRLEYLIQAHGDLSSFVDFLDRFYRLPLLHRIRTVRLQRTTGSRQNELDINLTVEALVLEGAEKRTKLLPEGVKVTDKLARTTTQYASIAGRDVFFGPPPPAPREERPVSQIDVLEWITLDELTHSESGSTASLYDPVNNYRYQIRRRDDGSHSIEVLYYVKERKRVLYSEKELALRNDLNEAAARFEVVRIDATDIILKSKEKYYSLHIGGRVRDVRELSSSQLKTLGLAPSKPTVPETKTGTDADPKKAAPSSPVEKNEGDKGKVAPPVVEKKPTSPPAASPNLEKK
jgi:hypothetical protein